MPFAFGVGVAFAGRAARLAPVRGTCVDFVPVRSARSTSKSSLASQRSTADVYSARVAFGMLYESTPLTPSFRHTEKYGLLSLSWWQRSTAV